MGPGFRVHGDDVGARLGKGLDAGVDGGDHQMHFSGFFVCRRIACTTMGPIEMLGTK